MMSPQARRRARRAAKMKAKHDKREKKFQLGVRLVDNKIPKYNSKKDPMCPIRFKRKSKRSKLNEKEEAEEAKIIDNLLEQSLAYMPNDSLASASRISHTSQGTRMSSSSKNNNKKNNRRQRPKTASGTLSSSRINTRPKTAGATLSTSSLNTKSYISTRSNKTSTSSLNTKSYVSTRSNKTTRSNSNHNKSEILDSFNNITYQDGPMQDDDHGEDDVELLKHVLYREQCLADLKHLSKAFIKIHPAVNAKSTQILAKMIDIIEGMRTASLIIVEGIWHWRYKRIVSLLHRRRLPAPGINHKPYPFVYDGDNYLLKMAFDISFLDELPPLIEWLGTNFHRNTFCIKTEDTLDSINATSILESGETVEAAAQNAPLPSDAPYIDRLRWASSVILAEESMRGQFVPQISGLHEQSSILSNGDFREKEASGGDNIAANNNKTKKKIKIIDDIDATLNSAKNKMLLQEVEAKKRDDDTTYKNEITNMKEEIERRRRRRGEKVDSLFYKDKSGGENPSGAHRLMKILKKNKQLREELKLLQSELDILSVETEAMEAEEEELEAAAEKEQQEDSKNTTGGNSEQYFQNFKPSF